MSKKAENMKVLFNPASAAVVGASDKPDKLGFHVMKSLISGGFAGRIIPVNPNSDEIMGLKAFPSLADYNEPIDLAILVFAGETDPRGVPGMRGQGGQRHCPDYSGVQRN